MLDTSVLISIERGLELEALQEFDFVIPTLVLAEFEYGLRRMPAQASKRGWKILEALLEVSEIASFDSKAASKYAELKNTLATIGKPRSEMDLLIASIAASLGLQLVSTDRRAQFELIPGVKLHPLSHKLQ
ncbi:MAG TPA: type II toxin-antitoxin system VapC family toxin [Microbacteriaceae bacterium]